MNFVDNEEDAVLVANLPQSLEVTLGSGNVSSFSENGFENESSGVTRSGLLLEEELEAEEGLLNEFVIRGSVVETELMPVRVRSGENTRLRDKEAH